MPIPYRRDLAPMLTEFADRHRGVRLGKMFGLPAIYVGRRLVTCLIEDGIIVRLPEDLARSEVRARRGAWYSPAGGRYGKWVMYRPRTAARARALTAVIEAAVQYMAERQTEEITGVRFRRR
jgi:hypothetical protein